MPENASLTTEELLHALTEAETQYKDNGAALEESEIKFEKLDASHEVQMLSQTVQGQVVPIDGKVFQDEWATYYDDGGQPKRIKGTIITDAVTQYYDALVPGEKPKKIIYVAPESTSLRTIRVLINGNGEENAISDSGSQIVSMARRVAEELGIIWDPDRIIYMQSANGISEPSMGLAKNVPFLVEGITLFLQVHILKNPAYRVLLGRTFDTLCSSVVENRPDGSQNITIKDPNSGKRVTIPTHPRDMPPKVITRAENQDEDFRQSMN
jgi:hypothetical protein